jgi:CheY-like chemotaxis protein
MKILVIDDDAAIGMAIRALLRSESCDVVVVESGRLGLKALEQSRFDLALIDIFMPGMDGIETIRRCHRSASTMPIVAMSGFRFRYNWGTAPNYLKIACKLGATRYLRKPFEPTELFAAILGCVARHGFEAEPLRNVVSDRVD